MPAITPDITESNLFQVLGDFIAGVSDPAVEIVRGMGNRVPMPVGECVVMTPITSGPLSTPISTYTATLRTIMQPTQFGAQIDCMGDTANDRARALTMLLRTDYACDVFAASGLAIQPLYCDDARQIPLVSGEQQYVERWTFNVVMQYNPRVSVSQDSATQLTVGTVNVDRTYNP